MPLTLFLSNWPLQGTPDDWIPRHPELIRLTGRHPFNVEPPLPRVVEAGFITPTSLHYVRNHGAVPRLDLSHKVAVTGLVDRPVDLSMEFLRSGVLPEVTIPVTLVCAGNRRKEENMIRQGLGFSWGAAAVSNAMWTGVWLKDVLEYAGIKSHDDGARHVCILGADKLPNGYYGTSIRREVAMDPAADVLIAYK
jgi:nitrate reductase (NAD(P)H)